MQLNLSETMDSRWNHQLRLTFILNNEKWTSTTTVLNLLQKGYGQKAKAGFYYITQLLQDLAYAREKCRFLLLCKNLEIFPKHITNACKNISDLFLHSKLCNRVLHEFIFKVKNRLLRTEIKDINMHINYLNRKTDSTITELENTISKDVLDLLVKFYE